MTSSPSSSAFRSSISSLVARIQEAARVVEDCYLSESSMNSSGVPALDDAKEHPLDHQSNMSRETRTAVQIIEATCAQLVDTVNNPHYTLMNRFMEFYHPAPEGMHISDIGKKTGIQERKIGRVLRMLASRHIFNEVSEDTFSNNRLSNCLRSSNPLFDAGLHSTDESVSSSILLPELLTDKEWGNSFEHNETAFNKFTGYAGTLWDYYDCDHPIGVNRGEKFGRSLAAWASVLNSLAVVHVYPWDKLGDTVSVCDIGCGIGVMSMALAKAHPNLSFILQDLPTRMHQAKNEVWPQKCADILAANRVQFVPVDFFVDPPVAACDIYYLANIIHDWSDEICMRLLSNIRQSMAPNSRILIHDLILQQTCTPKGKSNDHDGQAAPPFQVHFNLDIHFLTMLNSEVRTLPHYVKLGEAAGLEFVKLWDLGESNILEYKIL